jgi:hypothetical protein
VRATNVSRNRIWLARAIAVGADAMQLGIFPLFAEGFASPLNMITDVVVAGVMTFLVGFHIAFVPSFLIEMFPMIDLAPTWTIAILIATRGSTKRPVIDVTEKPVSGQDR